MVGLFLVMLAVFIIYIAIVVRNYGVQKSISESFYCFPVRLRFVFTIFCWGISLPVMIIATSPYMFVAGIAIALVGVANTFHEKFVNKFHISGIIIWILASQAYILFDQHLYFLNITFLVFGLIVIVTTIVFKKDFKYLWWIEMATFACIFYTFYLKLFTI